ncbi:MAG: slipin family protein [bacterium]|nr:slipin family protein [bacterium]
MVNIRKFERGLLFRNGDFVRMLGAGSHFVLPVGGYTVEVVDMRPAFRPQQPLDIFLADEKLAADLEVLDIAEHELVLHFSEGKLVGLLLAGRHAFFRGVLPRKFLRFDIREPEIPIRRRAAGARSGAATRSSGEAQTATGNQDDTQSAPTSPTIDAAWLGNAALAPSVQRYQIEAHEAGLLYFDGVLQRTLKPGAYDFWRGPVQVKVEKVDLRQLQVDMTGQEIMTEDRITLRVNFVCQYKIVDPVKAVTGIRSYGEQLYIILQLILREYVGTLKLDELLQKKEEINQFVLKRLKEQGAGLGLEFIAAGVKDVILPGEIKEILNLVLVAEKKAQANLIMRREETASTRSLLNTAKLMDDNPVLYRLKELEYLERISEKIGNVSLMGGGSLLEHLSGVIAKKQEPYSH